jgi:hypothetical protein
MFALYSCTSIVSVKGILSGDQNINLIGSQRRPPVHKLFGQLELGLQETPEPVLCRFQMVEECHLKKAADYRWNRGPRIRITWNVKAAFGADHADVIRRIQTPFSRADI